MTAFRSPTWWVGIAMIAVAVYAMIEAAPWSTGGRLFPWVVGGALILCAGIHTIVGLVAGITAEASAQEADGKPIARKWRLQVLAWVALMLVMVPLIGHLAAVPLYILGFMVVMGESRWLAAILAAIVWAFIYLILEGIVHVGLPPPLLLQWLG